MNHEEFRNNYTMFPLRNQLLNYANKIKMLGDQKAEIKVELQNLEEWKKLLKKPNVYIPFCMCLVSKYPFYFQMEKCLKSILLSIKNNITKEKLHNLFLYIVKSIPLPPLKSKISFDLPYVYKPCEIKYPYFQDRLEFGDDPIFILKKLSIDNIFCLFNLLITEQRLLIVGNENDTISKFMLNFLPLIYPIENCSTFIPLIGVNLEKFLSTFLVFFCGINKSLYEKYENIIKKNNRKVFILNLEENKIVLNKNLKDIININNIYKEIGEFPEDIKNIFLDELKAIKKDFNKRPNHNVDKEDLNIRIKNLFLYIMVLLLYGYEKHTHKIDKECCFNKVSFLNEKKNKSEKEFYDILISTQMYQVFYENSVFRDKKNYFDDYYKKYQEYKKTLSEKIIFSKMLEKFQKDYLDNFETDKGYSIRAETLKELFLFDNKSFDLKFNEFYRNYTTYFNNTGILKKKKE